MERAEEDAEKPQQSSRRNGSAKSKKVSFEQSLQAFCEAKALPAAMLKVYKKHTREEILSFFANGGLFATALQQMSDDKQSLTKQMQAGFMEPGTLVAGVVVEKMLPIFSRFKLADIDSASPPDPVLQQLQKMEDPAGMLECVRNHLGQASDQWFSGIKTLIERYTTSASEHVDPKRCRRNEPCVLISDANMDNADANLLGSCRNLDGVHKCESSAVSAQAEEPAEARKKKANPSTPSLPGQKDPAGRAAAIPNPPLPLPLTVSQLTPPPTTQKPAPAVVKLEAAAGKVASPPVSTEIGARPTVSKPTESSFVPVAVPEPLRGGVVAAAPENILSPSDIKKLMIHRSSSSSARQPPASTKTQSERERRGDNAGGDNFMDRLEKLKKLYKDAETHQQLLL